MEHAQPVVHTKSVVKLLLGPPYVKGVNDLDKGLLFFLEQVILVPHAVAALLLALLILKLFTLSLSMDESEAILHALVQNVPVVSISPLRRKFKKHSLKSQGGMEAVVVCSNLQSLDCINEDENEFMTSLLSALGQLIILIKPASPLMQISVINGPAFFLEDLSTSVKMRMILIAWTRTLNALISTLSIAVMKNFQMLHLRLESMSHRPSIILDS